MKSINTQSISFRLTLFSLIFFVLSCNKPDQQHGDPSPKADTYSSDVVLKWLDFKYKIQGNLQQQLIKPGSTDRYINRYYAYVGICLYESVVTGMPAYQSLSGQLTDMPPMPRVENGKEYYWPASANAALSFLNKKLLYSATDATKISIDSLEGALTFDYKAKTDSATLQRSVDFGRAVAKAIFDWSETDGINTIYPPYVPPTAPGLWEPTPPAFSAATLVHYGDFRPLMPGVLSETMPGPPHTYSTDPASDYYKSMKEVYDVSKSRTAADSLRVVNFLGNTRLWYSIFKKVLIDEGNAASLEKAALADCKMGMAQFDAAIVGWKTKYIYNVQRPITFIRKVLGYTTWNSQQPANSNPDYPDGVVPDYSSSAGALSSVFGKNYQFTTDGVNNNLPQGYSFSSFEEAGNQGGQTRFIAGVTT